ncbi:hypothetical protein [Microbulbifer spongiae]|uniref:HEAT repeat domain-containing protein n=1 Tax=Microbulbifer spongiae TaxID=2944933 RepID=A0ABY9EBD8_9GAMM|nr:hypothetical protein [Microbulbifer sp. MI-G]WKD50338.1 hypothetical protein M8T91_02590 [Microbulbifer sp. MI-G]
MNTKKLLEKASTGTITENEVKLVYNALVNHASDEYDLLLTLGRAGAKQYRDVVEGYLNSPHDPMLARVALQILCRYWGLAKEFKDTLAKFIKIVDWDEEEDVRMMAIGCVAEVFKQESSPELLGYVYDVFENPEEDEVIRGAAYETLALVAGKSVKELPQPQHFDLNKDVDPSVLKRTKKVILGVNC